MLFKTSFATAALAVLAAIPVQAQRCHGVRGRVSVDAECALPAHRNVIIFVADGMRHGSVNATDAPTMLRMRQRGVHFLNSHSLFPTFTTANASAIASGHMLGDTGDYSNTIDAGFLARTTGGKRTVTPFIEDDAVLRDLDDHYAGNWLHEDSLIGLARKSGYNTAVIGKLGPVGVQDAAQLTTGTAPATVFVDDQTGSATGIPLRPDAAAAIKAAGLPLKAPDRSNGCALKSRCDNGYSGTATVPGTDRANVEQQRYFQNALTAAVLPMFEQQSQGQGKPFAILFWSRDPDGTQHDQGDSLQDYTVGINGPTSKAAIHNADDNLRAILDWLDAHPGVAKNTDVFLTADHGYATISRSGVDARGTHTRSYAAGFDYRDAKGELEEPHGFLPYGFVAIDLAHNLGLPLWDPESPRGDIYQQVDPSGYIGGSRQRPQQGSGLIGGTGSVPADPRQAPDAQVIVAANGGSDLIYVPGHDAALLKRVVASLLQQDYMGAVFVDDTYGSIPGTLPMSLAGLQGSAAVPRPAVVISFTTFYTVPPLSAVDRLMHAVQIADTGLQQGQGMHGSFGRDNTFNNMAAIGPDFRAGFADDLPVSNADITPTLAHLMGLTVEPAGKLTGRVLDEALVSGAGERARVKQKSARAKGKAYSVRLLSQQPAADRRTVLHIQNYGGKTYFDDACLISAAAKTSAAASTDECRP